MPDKKKKTPPHTSRRQIPRDERGFFLPVDFSVLSREFAEHRERRRAPAARRDDREYREYLREEQRRSRGAAAFECQ